ncbi:UvrD-helicase domain-containing protein [Pedobacter panaciterrae]
MQIKTITSDDLIDIEQPFKVAAGPGAGKTHWLVNHIRQVLTHSKRLGCYRKIACITYTNTAVNTIMGRLNFAVDRVEISTIHSFIYNNILKPYMHFIADRYEFNVRNMDGHDDHFISRSNIKEWIDNYQGAANLRHPFSRNQLLRLENNLKALGNWLSSIYYQYNGSNLEIALDNAKAFDRVSSTRLGKACLDVLSPGIEEYKKIFWRKGKLHHEDVLYFGYQLIKEYPFIVTILQAKFPYFFVDEFQDTSPIQTEIIKLLAQKETVIGIIGDKAQAIYSFQGAASGDFEVFSLAGQQDYVIADNRRSTSQIVDVLNHLRRDIRQNPVRNELGAKPVLFVGSKEIAFAQATLACGGETLITLSRDNVMVNAMKRLYNQAIPASNLLEDLFAKDNVDRVKVIVRCMTAVELGLEKRFKEAIKEMEKINFNIQEKKARKKTAFNQLSLLLSKYPAFKDHALLDFYELVKADIKTDIPALTRGAIKVFYEAHTYAQIALFIKINDENLDCRTVHKAKGDEFDNVLFTMTSDVEVGYLVSPNLTIEEQRIRYVALSRARQRLFVNVPTLNPQAEASLKNLFDIKR